MERIIRNCLYRIVFFRILGDLVAESRNVLHALSNFFAGIEKALWLVEIEEARKYRAATGVDPGHSIGESFRYSRAFGTQPAEVETD